LISHLATFLLEEVKSCLFELIRCFLLGYCSELVNVHQIKDWSVNQSLHLYQLSCLACMYDDRLIFYYAAYCGLSHYIIVLWPRFNELMFVKLYYQIEYR